MRLLTVAFASQLLLLAGSLTAQEWTRFRGPNGSGESPATGLPVSWTADDYNWNVELPGTGHSSPVAWGGRIFLNSGSKQGERIVLSLDAAEGKLLWQRQYPGPANRMHKRNSYGSSTPAVDADHVYVNWGTPEENVLLALDHDGRDVWRRDLGKYVSGHGSGTSPILYEDLVVLSNDHGGEAFLLAVDRRTGETRWKLERRPHGAGYSTPCVYHRDGHDDELIFTDWEHGITSVDPRTGKMNWELDCFGKQQKKRAIGSPVIAGEVVIGTACFANGPKYLVAVAPDPASGAMREIYRFDRSVPHVPTALVHGGLLFMWADDGIVTCADATTGKEHWKKRVGGNFSGSPICADGRLYCVSEDGEVVVLAAAAEYELLARNQLGAPSRSTPAVIGGRLYLRTYSNLISLGLSGDQ